MPSISACSPPARSAADAVVAHPPSVGIGGSYRSARIGGKSLVSSLAVMTVRRSPSLDSLMPSRIALLITTYSTQKNKISAMISIATEKIAIRVSSASKPLILNIARSPSVGWIVALSLGA